MKRAREGDGFAHDLQEFENDRGRSELRSRGFEKAAHFIHRPRRVDGAIEPRNRGSLEVQAIKFTLAQRAHIPVVCFSKPKSRGGVHPSEQAWIACRVAGSRGRLALD